MSRNSAAKLLAPKSHTRFGTPLSPNWDEDWSALVEATEVRLSRRICGARTIDGGPCTLFSDHGSGRCRFHGGFELTGGQPGNRNGVLHGLFVRRLQDCGTHCPRFGRCPMAGPDVAELPATDRPVCPYESAEYEASVADILQRLESGMLVEAYTAQYAHHVALLQVMVGRAARSLAAGGEQACFDAYLRLSAEYRRTLRYVLPTRSANGSSRGRGSGEEKGEQRPASLADLMAPIIRASEGILEECLDPSPGVLTGAELEEERRRLAVGDY